ncbi:MAG: hypothetical protein KC464_16320 [Myxococcales bacterium]|nr:hypothetical protein [Myxococcales bacterium]
MKPTIVFVSLVGLGVAAGVVAPAPAGAHPAHHRSPLSFAVIGDAPYGTSPSDTTQLELLPAFVDAINADADLHYVVDAGDIHSGKQYCTEAYDQAIFDLWQQFAVPLIYTPGDNEWTDCHKPAEGGGTYDATTGQVAYVLDADGDPVDYAGGDPIANLDLIRRTFFARPGVALGGGRMFVASQAWFFDWRHPDDADFVENVIWTERDVVFVTVNVPGGSNNDQDVWYGAPTESAAQADERAARTGADRRWLDTAFTLARLTRARAVVITMQADMWDPEKGAAHQAGYEPIIQTLAADALAFGGPVLMFNGDSHDFLSDNPLAADAPLAYMHPGYDVPNFHRVVVHGSKLPFEYLRVTIDPRGAAGADDEDFGPFRWQRVVPTLDAP